MSGWKDWQQLEVVNESDFQNFVQDQVVQVYTNATARTTALNGGVAATFGMVSYLTSTNSLEIYTTEGWVPVKQQVATSPNYIINGGFDVWQRGTSFTSSTSFTADRWNCTRDGSSSVNVTQESFAAGDNLIGLVGSPFYMRLAGTVVSSQPFYARQFIEDVRTLAGEVVTLSYWAKANTTVTNTPLAAQGFGSGGSSAVVTSLSSSTITTSWQRFTHTFTVPSISGKTIGVNNSLQIQVIRVSTTSTIDLWGVQLEAGSVATPFRRNAPSLQGELAACQRYYFETNEIGVANARVGQGPASSTTRYFPAVNAPVPLRVGGSSLSLTISALSDFGGPPTAIIIDGSGSTNRIVNLRVDVASGLTAGNFYQLSAGNNVNARLGISAEL